MQRHTSSSDGSNEYSVEDYPSKGQQHTFGEKDVAIGHDRTVEVRGHEVSADTALHRGLKARHITMIAIGGAIGTGLIIVGRQQGLQDAY